MEKNYTENASRDDTIKLTIKSLLEVVQTGAKNIEISVMEGYNKVVVCVELLFVLFGDILMRACALRHSRTWTLPK